MKVARLHIENFRSIRSLDFEPGGHCVLIGENNAGKSNVLRAIGLVLGDTWPSERSFSEDDFFNRDTDKDIVIQVFFDSTWEDWQNNHEAEIAGFELRCKAYKRKVGDKPAGTLKVDYYCIDAEGKVVAHPDSAFQKGQQFKGRWLPRRVSSEFRDKVPFIYVDVLREYDRQTPSSRWSVLRRLFSEVNTAFLHDKKEVTVRLPDGSKTKMTRKAAFESTVREAYQYLRTDLFDDIEKRLRTNALQQMGIDESDGDVSLSFQAHDPTNAYKSLDLFVSQLGVETSASEVGAGLQSAIVVAIFRTYEELKKAGAIFAIEEPEVFLHPQKARYFASILRSLADGENQVFLTTHSPVFVQVHEPESVAVVQRTKENGTLVHSAERVDLAPDQRKELRLLTEFDAQRNELFFARKVLFVEGNTEKVALPLALRALGVDVNREGISIIECGGKTKIPLFVRVARALRIPHVVLADDDLYPIDPAWSEARMREEEAKQAKHRRWNRDITDVASAGSVHFLSPNFERALGLSGDESIKVDQALSRFRDCTAESFPPELRAVLDALLLLEPATRINTSTPAAAPAEEASQGKPPRSDAVHPGSSCR